MEQRLETDWLAVGLVQQAKRHHGPYQSEQNIKKIDAAVFQLVFHLVW